MVFQEDNGGRVIAREMATLAAEIAVDGEKRLVIGRRTERYMQKLPGMIARARALWDCDALRELAMSARTLQACARRAHVDSGAKLPACGGSARVMLIAGRLIASGDRMVDLNMIKSALAAFDEAQGLKMAEFWAFPEAARICLCEAAAFCAGQLLSDAEESERARKWVENAGAEADISGRSPAFYERALQLAMDMEKPEARLRIENVLARQDATAEMMVRRAQERRALAVMRIGNLLALCRTLEAADWQKAFEETSHTEAELRRDPSGAYSEMTSESRDALRRQLAVLAKRTGAGELTTARYAVNAAREADESDVRRCVCWWIYDDDGRRALAERLGVKKRLPKLRPDPHGYWIMGVQTLISVALSVILARVCGAWWWGIVLFAPVWGFISYAIARIVTRVMRPRAVLRLDIANLPDDARTLVAIPALLTSPGRARSLCRQLETLGCIERDENLEFVLLGDFADAQTHTCDTDAAIIAAAREEIGRMNAAAGRVKYHYLHRERDFAESDGIWRGKERKRGALMALCRVATGRSRGEFAAEGAAEENIFGRFRYVLTLDADTKILPGTAHALAGAMLHPLNRPCFDGLRRRGFSVLQPRVELDAKESVNGFVRLFAGAGGMSTYSGMASDMYHDLTGTGAYCGKAMLDMNAFLEYVEGKLDPERILSHDFIEGALAGTGHANDISVYDGFPADFRRWLDRLERWTRGDWQLIPDIFRGDMPLLARFRMVSNIIDSLSELSLVILFVLAVWLGNVSEFALAIVLAFAAPLLARLAGDKQALTRGCISLAALPAVAFTRAGAACRALWRMFVSKRGLLEWVTSADAKGDGTIARIACRAAAILLVPGLFSAGWFAPAAALIALFLVAPGVLSDMADAPAEKKQPLGTDARRELESIARDTWRFFEMYVDKTGNFLPPDNVQEDPGPRVARRTSPTNIAMYLLACVCARDMGFIGGDEMRARMADTVATLERMDKWHGHIYNWYDIDTLSVLRPAYVSSVDSGNLAAALLACANACEDGALGERLRKIAGDMELAALYDADRNLFRIGADVDNTRLSASHYDLMASESRILSYTAMMLGQIPIKHWCALGRPASDGVLMSWSGTIFEYLMPALIMPSAPGTLLSETYRGMVRTQMKYAATRNRPWGVSESGYHSFDMDMNYQYRAFGMHSLSMSGAAPQDVLAPYAACLGLMVEPEEAVKNILAIRESGWAGECGLYEAVDFVRAQPRPVKSWMAHHQGMALCAITNLLTGNRLQEYFMADPRARALELLLNECAAPRIKLKSVPDAEAAAPRRAGDHGVRRGRSESSLADSALLGGGDGTVFVTARGDVAYSRRGILANRFTGDLLRRRDSMFTCLISAEGMRTYLNSDKAKSRFAPGEAVFTARQGDVEAVMRMCVSPENGALVKLVALENTGDEAVHIRVIDGFEAALMDAGELRSHPAFFRLFLRADLSYENTIILRRRSREAGGMEKALFHTCTWHDCARETDWLRLMGRENVLNTEFAGCSGALTDPCSAICADIRLEPGEKREIAFAVGISDAPGKEYAKYTDIAAARRALALAGAYALSAAGFAGLDDEKRILAERALALLVDPRLAHRQGVGAASGAPGDHADLPNICVVLDGPGGLDVLRDAVRMHEYCRSMGFIYQLNVIDDQPASYDRPVHDGIQELIGATHLRDMFFARGGVNLYAASTLDDTRRQAIIRAAALVLDGRSGMWAQLRRALMALHCALPGRNRPMAIAAAAGEFGAGRLDNAGYSFDISAGCLPPAPWSNINMAENIGMLITERGGGFMWHKNSRLRRITNFDNDPACEGWGFMLYVSDREGRFLRALPGDTPLTPFRVCHGLAETIFTTATDDIEITTTVFGDRQNDELVFMVEIKNLTGRTQEMRITGFADWLMGADSADAARARTWNHDGALLAAGALDAAAYLACDMEDATPGPQRSVFLGRGGVMCPDGLNARGDGGCALMGGVTVPAKGTGKAVFRMGYAGDAAQAAALAARHTDADAAHGEAERYWRDMQGKFSVFTGDMQLDALLNGFLLKQVIDGRIRARAGFYQAGGAYGFRDQLQDMLAILPYDPETVRGHILMCAERQFEDGDVMHWWHPPMTGVRTKISDDLLFLPFVTAKYIQATGDMEILDEKLYYLENIEIPAGREDIYADMHLSMERGTLREHCLRVLRRAYRRGAHGLLLMGAGDWNDGMNRVGSEGRGESVWLSMFFSVCARLFIPFAEDGDAEWLKEAANAQLAAVSENGWDGRWFLRAYDDDGMQLGSRENAECRIDLISQAWAVLSGCANARTKQAMDLAWRELYDSDHLMMKLLAPPFEGKESDPGYIAAYPPGVRENGGQYTHAACWYLAALAAMGDCERARTMLHALMPMNHTEREPEIYRVEPYVLAADIYGAEPYAGRGGWTWYTGSAGWFMCAARMLLGYERRGERVRMNALAGMWERPCIRVGYGRSVYVLYSEKDAESVTMDAAPIAGEFIVMKDDGKEHICVFPQRRGECTDILAKI